MVFCDVSGRIARELVNMEDLEAVRDLDPSEVQRRFRLMEDDRKAYLELSNNAIRLQRLDDLDLACRVGDILGTFCMLKHVSALPWDSLRVNSRTPLTEVRPRVGHGVSMKFEGN